MYSTLPVGLRLSRLREVAALMTRTRAHIIETVYDRAVDEGWGINCLIFDRIRKAIKISADGEFANWLAVIEPGLHFVFTIDGTPLRFYRGKKDRRAPSGQLHMNASEALAYQLTVLPLLDSAYAEEPRFYRLMYETDPQTLLIVKTFLVAVDKNGSVVHAWRIHREGGNDVLPISSAEPPIDLPPVPVALVEDLIAAEEAEIRAEEEVCDLSVPG